MNLGPDSFSPLAPEITFDGVPLGTANPVYNLPNLPTLGDVTVSFAGSFVGQQATAGFPVTLDPHQPSSPLTLDSSGPSVFTVDDGASDSNPVLSGTPTFNGPISVRFSVPVAAVGLKGGYFDSVGSTTIEAYDESGNILGSISNSTTGFEFYGLADSSGENVIAGISFFITGDEPAGFAIDNLTFGASDMIVTLAAPTNVQASDGDFDDRVHVTWDAVANALGYGIWRNTVNDPTTAVDQGVCVPTTAYDDFTAQVERPYYYWVKAIGSAGSSDFSDPDTGYAHDRSAPTACLDDPSEASWVRAADINARGYIDVTFLDNGGSGLDTDSILDPTAEFSLVGSAKNNVIVNGSPTLVPGTDSTYRYRFTGRFRDGVVEVAFAAGGWRDGAKNPSSPSYGYFGIANVTQHGATLRTPTGWFYPLDRVVASDSDYKWLASGKDAYLDGLTHIGADLSADVNDPVYAIGSGRVLYVSGPKEESGWGKGNYALAIVHHGLQGDFVAVYGHIKTALKVGDPVIAGQPIGKIGPFSLGSHLHFGVHPGPASNFPATGWGRVNETEFLASGFTNGFVDPIKWINEGSNPLA